METMNRKRPFCQVLSQYYSNLSISLPRSSTVPQTPRPLSKDHSSFELIDYTRALDRVQQLTSITEKLTFICRLGHLNDSVAVRLLKDSLLGIGSNELAGTTEMKDQPSLLHLCAQRNMVQCMEILVENGANVNSSDAISATPLFYACAHNHEDAVVFLLHNGAVSSSRDIYGNTPLMIAVKNRSYNIVELLLLYKADIHVKGYKGNTILHHAAIVGDLETVQFLITKCGASALHQNNDKETVLFVSLMYPDIVRYLCDEYRDKGVSKLLLSKNSSGHNPFHHCAIKGYYESFLLILHNLCRNDMENEQIHNLLKEPDHAGATPLIMATQNNSLDIVHFLCSCKENEVDSVDVKGNSALHYAVQLQSRQLVEELVCIGGASKSVMNKEKVSCSQLAEQLQFDISFCDNADLEKKESKWFITARFFRVLPRVKRRLSHASSSSLPAL